MHLKRTALVALVPAFALGYLACVGEPVSESEESSIVEDEAAMVAPLPSILGTYRNQDYHIGALTLLVLKLDGTYHRGMVVGCVATLPCLPAAEDGHYRLWGRDGASYLSLRPDDTAGVVEQYRYTLAGDTLRIQRVGSPTWMSLQKTTDTAWCAEPDDCALQNLPPGPCAAKWQCGANMCTYRCRLTWPTE